MSETKKLNEIEIDDLIKSVYTKIAEWHNDDSSQSGLKYTTIEIIQECTNNTLKQLGMEEIVTDVKLDKTTRKEALKLDNESSKEDLAN